MIRKQISPLAAAVTAITLASLLGSGSAFAQSAAELDLTISVIQEGETPAGFINRLELPSLDTALNVRRSAQAQVIEDTVVDAITVSDNATQVASDTIREIISVDGTVAGSVSGTNGGLDINGNAGIGILPPAIVDILDPALPLTDTLTDSLGNIGGVVDNISNLEIPVLSTNADASGLNELLINDAINAPADQIVDSLSLPITESVDSLIMDDTIHSNIPLEELQNFPVDDSAIGDSLAPVTDSVSEILEAPGL
jgi:hypothetical protein